MTGLAPLRRQLLLQYLVTIGLLLAVAEVALYWQMHWANERELDAVLHKEITRLAAAVEYDKDKAKLDGKKALTRTPADGLPTSWQVLRADGGTVALSRNLKGSTNGNLPAVGGDEATQEIVHITDIATEGGVPVRAARLLTVRQRNDPDDPPKVVKNKSKAPAADLWGKGKIHGLDPWGKGKGKSKGPFFPVSPHTPHAPPAPPAVPALPQGPEEMTFDIRVVVDRSRLDGQLQQLGGSLLVGYPLALLLAGGGGMLLIRRAVRPVERAFQRERRFTGAASHELRTPLTALRGEIEVTLRRERTPKEYADALQRMEGLACRMTGLVEGLLLLARARAGHLLLGATRVPLASFHEAIDDVLRVLPGRERVEFLWQADGKQRITGDGLLLALAVRNLVENALIHAPKSGVAVRVAPAAAGGLCVQVHDQGPGIPAPILEEFRRSGSQMPVKPNGRPGLGLSIARAVVEAHQGRLTLENVASGCRATLWLPTALAV